jgi:polyhydroxybutyrate depolymerase
MRAGAFVAAAVLGWFVVVAMRPGALRAQPAPPALAAGDHTFALQHDGRRRTYVVHAPRVAAAGSGAPVVLAFHGGGGEAEGFKAYAGLDAVADREGFIAAYPNGSGVLPRRLLTWNAGECCAYAMNQRIDDVGFAIAVLDDLAKRITIDPARVYATGHSNGAMMAYRLAAERADRIAAIVPVAGAHGQSAFAPSRRVAVLAIHSVDDPRARYGGGVGPPFPGTDVRSSHRPVMESLDRWRRHNGCSETPKAVTELSAGTGRTAETATLLQWQGCGSGGQVAHWKLTASGHGWPGVARAALREALIGPPTTIVNAADEIWKFVAAFRRES